MGIINRDCDNFPEPEYRRVRRLTKEDTVWINFRGEEVLLENMSTEYIKNCLKMMDKQLEVPSDWCIYNILNSELKDRNN